MVMKRHQSMFGFQKCTLSDLKVMYYSVSVNSERGSEHAMADVRCISSSFNISVSNTPSRVGGVHDKGELKLVSFVTGGRIIVLVRLQLYQFEPSKVVFLSMHDRTPHCTVTELYGMVQDSPASDPQGLSKMFRSVMTCPSLI